MELIAQHKQDLSSYRLKVGRNLIGRSDRCEITLESSWTIASNVHMVIELGTDGSIKVMDGYEGKPSTNGTQLNNTYLSADQWTTLSEGDELKIGNDSRECIRLKIRSGLTAAQSMQPSSQDNDITIGRDEQCSIRINGPTISRIHAVIKRRGNTTRLIDNSQNGIYVNGEKSPRSRDLRIGDEIKIGTHIFVWANGGQLVRETLGKNYRIDVEGLFLKGRISGSSLAIEPGQLVAFVGGSGAGKSSLLTTLVGHNMDYQGSITINGSELRDSYNSIKQEIGFVPQDDIVHMDLTVEEVLRYSARLKLPDRESQRDAVEKALTELEISHRRKAKIKDLSGGQRKRVSIGVELLADPRILFLDEPTSGLDPGLDKRMMQLLRSLADGGRTVALVTHATNNVMLCDQVVFLGRGGYLCYAGRPQDCNKYFGVDGDFSDVYQRLEVSDNEIQHLSEQFRSRQAIGPNRKNSAEITAPTRSSDSIIERFNEFFPQFQTLISRDIKLQSRDITSIALNAITAPAAAFMLAVAANNRGIFNATQNGSFNTYLDAQRILFVIVCSCVWVGLSSSLQTIVRERPIFKRERAFNLLPEAYLLAKVLVMLGTSLIQAVLLAATVSVLFEYPTDIGPLWAIRIGVAAFITLVSVGSQALLVSSLVKNSQQASSFAPLLLIPQLVFGGVLFNLSESSSSLYTVISSRWSMILMGCWSDITTLITGKASSYIDLSKIEGADAYVNSIANIHEAIVYLSLQALMLITATVFSLLFYRKNRQ